MLKPSDFYVFPSNSIAGSYKAEYVALNIMRILKRTGDKFRVLTWAEYKHERFKDGGFSRREKTLFDDWGGYCMTARMAQDFSRVWRKDEIE